MEISQHIKDLLYTHDSVVLPGFGTFSARYTPATVDETTNTMSPPSKTILFDAEKTKSTGLLERHMAQREGISAGDAGKQIDEFVKTVKSKLKAGKQVSFAELGFFEVIKDNQLLFTYEPSGNLLLKSYGLSKISLPENIAPGEAKHDGTSKAGKNRAWVVWASVVLLLILLLGSVYFFKKDWWDSGTNYITQIFKGDSTNPPDDNDDSAGTDKSDELLVDDDTDKNPPPNDNTDKTDETDESDTDKPDSTADTDTEPASSDTEYDGQYKIPQKGNVYVIVGSLPTAELAEIQKQTMLKKGIEVEILPFDNNKYRLSAGSFRSVNQAVAFYNKLHQKHKTVDVWMWEYK